MCRRPGGGPKPGQRGVVFHHRAAVSVGSSPRGQPFCQGVAHCESSVLVEADYAGASDVRVEHDLAFGLADPEGAEFSAAVIDLVGGGDGSV